MPKKKVEKEVAEEVVEEKVEEVEEVATNGDGPVMYKDYDIKWLKNNSDHPEFGLVAEYEEKYGEI